LGIPLAGVHLSDVYKAKVGDSPFLWIHSTKKEELFARTFGNDTWSEPTHLSIADFAKSVPRELSWTGELIPEHTTLVSSLGMKKAEEKNADQRLPSLFSRLPYKMGLLLPWYGRGY